MKVALYARVSKDDQDNDGQLARLRTWASSAGHEVVLERAEKVSTRLVRRPLREEILQEARGRHVQAIAVCKLDRWGRGLIDIKTSLDELYRLGCHFYAVDQGIALTGKSDALGGFLLNVLGAFAEMERELISERTKEALAARKAAGVKLGRPWWKVKGMPKPTGEKAETEGGQVNARLPDPVERVRAAEMSGLPKPLQVPGEGKA